MEQILLLEEKLAFSEKIAAKISHKLNNALFTLSNSFQLSRRHLPTDNKRVNDAAQMIENEIKRIKNLSREMLIFIIQEIEHYTHADLTHIINAAVNTLKWSQKLKNTEIEFNRQQSSFPLLCYPGCLQQAFMNLFGNSVKTMSGKGKIKIDISEINHAYKIDIIDNGPGIPESVRSDIFLPIISTEPGKGSGSGLYITHQIIANHGGTITLDDSSIQQGAHFIISIPKEKQGGRNNDKKQIHTISR